MKLDLILIVIVLQVLAFQLLSTRLIRALPDLLIGSRNLPEAAARQVAAFKRRAGRTNVFLGILYLVACGVLGLMLPLDPHDRKLALAAISLLSSATLLTSYLIDRRHVTAIAKEIPDPPIRVAGLGPRSLGTNYPPILEALPIGVLLGTIAATAWADMRFPHPAGLSLWSLPLIQALYIFFTLGLTIRQVRSGSCLTWRARAFQGSPEEGIALEERVHRLEVRFLYLCRVGITLLLGVMQVQQVNAAIGRAPSQLLSAATWVIVTLLIGLLAIYLLKAAHAEDRLPAPAQPNSNPEWKRSVILQTGL